MTDYGMNELLINFVVYLMFSVHNIPFCYAKSEVPTRCC
jgi:hypothetical protein